MKIFAHRGSSILWPENTMLAFDNAHQAGATGFETDLRLSKDKEIVLSHDANLGRFGQPEVKICDLTMAELSECQVPSPDGRLKSSLVSLRVLLEAYPEKDYIFDCKISEKNLFVGLRDLLTTVSFHRRIWFLTWSRIADGYVREIFPESDYFPRASLTRLWGWSRMLGIQQALEPENRILALPAYYMNVPLIDEQLIDSLRSRGKTFVGYLVNDEKAYRRCRECGVETILTDRPDLIVRLGQLEEEARPLQE